MNSLEARFWRNISNPLILPLLLSALPAAAVEYTYTTNNGTITITQYTGPGGTVTIPAVITGLPVTSIGPQAFAYSVALTNVAIPNSVTNIGAGAFSECPNLTSVTIGNGVTSIGDQAFFYCAGLANVTIPNSVTNIGFESFYACSALPSVIIPGKVTTLANESFSWCTKMTSVTIPSSVTNIGNYAFDSCANLSVITVDAANPAYSSQAGVLFNKSQTSLLQCPGAKAGIYSVPNGVTSIGASAFANCNNLTGVAIPNSVTNIGASALSSCLGLSAITVDPLNSSYSSLAGVLFNKKQTLLIQCPAALAGSYAVPDSVTSILSTAFVGCQHVTAITATSLNSSYSSLAGVLFTKNQTTLVQCPGAITGSYSVPNSVTNIADYAFGFVPGLTAVSIPNTVITIGLATFAGCTGLTNLALPDSLISIGTEAFESCTRLTSVTFGKNLTNIGVYAFYKCTGLTNLSFPNSLTSIADRAFESCSSLTSVTLGNAIASIGSLSFGFCSNLSSLYFRGNAPKVDSAALVNDSATSYYRYGTTGWVSTFAGLPTALWNPLMQNSGAKTNGFGFNITGPVNMGFVVEASSSLASPVWSPVQTNQLSGGSALFNDPQWKNSPVRFYRIRSLVQ